MKNLEVAKLFDRAADILALLGENSFKIIAFRKISRVLEEHPSDIAALSVAELEAIPGIGKGSAERIAEYLRTGKIADFEDLASQVPAGVIEMTRIPTLGPKTAALLWQEGGVTTIEALKAKIDDGSLKNLKGLGEKKLQKIKENLAFLATSSGRVRIGEAMPIALELVSFLKTLPHVQDAQYCGSQRRGKETVGDIDIAVCAPLKHGQAIGEALTKHPLTASIIQLGESKTSIRTTTEIQVDMRVVPEESYGAAIQYFTGSKEHGVHLRELAIKKGLKLSEWGVFAVKGKTEKQIAGRTEEEVYAALGMPWIPPEIRENKGEIEAALASNAGASPASASPPPASASPSPASAYPSPASAFLPFELIQQSDIRGDLHMHTTASDGTNSIEELVAEAKRRGYQYLAVTDHSKSQFQANGLKVDRLLDHAQKIRAVAKEAAKSGILLLAGTECDILADGSLDYEDEVLEQLDWVVASPHAALTQDSEAATQRLVRAAANPLVHVIGHPTGRLVPSRRGLELDMPKLIAAALRSGVALEINASTYRLDLRDTHAHLAVLAGVPLCINTDAHALADFDQLQYGILTARRAWAKKDNVLNTLPLDQFKKWLKNRKEMDSWGS